MTEPVLPDRETAERNGWTHQVQWEDSSRPCFIRCKSLAEAEQRARRLRGLGCLDVEVLELFPTETRKRGRRPA